MKKIIAITVSVMLLFTFFGCDYYDDETVSIAFESPDSDGLIEYQAGISAKENAARINLLRYKLASVQDGQIKIKLPEKIKNESGKEYSIDSFGGAMGTNAPLERFSLIVQVETGTITENSMVLTVDVGSLPLDTSAWNDIQICYLSDNTEITIPVEDIVFLSNEPLDYYLHLKERDVSGETSNAMYSDKWYEIPNTYQVGGEKVVVRVKHSNEELTRTLSLNNTPLEPVEIYDEYIQFEFVMPYHDTSITIVDKQK